MLYFIDQTSEKDHHMSRNRIKKTPVTMLPVPQPAMIMPVWPAWVALGAVLFLAVTLGCREIASPDIGFHLNSGRWIAEHGAVPSGEMFVYPVLGRPYIDLQWLYQLMLWHGYQIGGPALLVAGNVALTLISFGLLVLRVRNREGRLPMGAVLLLLVFALGNDWELRPHVASWVCLNLVLLVLEVRSKSNPRAIWPLPFLMIVWANTHSLYILGLVAIGCHGLGVLAAAIVSRQWVQFRWFAGAAILAGLACFITPYGWRGVQFPFDQFTQLDAGSVFKSTTQGIAEFLSPLSLQGYLSQGRLVLTKPFLFVQLALALVLLGHLRGARRTSIAEWVLLLLFGYVFLKAQKNFGYFVIAAFPAAAAGLSSWAAVFLGSLPQATRRLASPLAAGLSVPASVGFVLWVASGGWYQASRSPHQPGFGFNERALPVAAARFLAAAPPARSVLNSFDHGGWVAFATGREVYIDGRTEVNGPDHFRDYLALKNPRTLEREILRLRPDWILVPLSGIPQWHEGLARSRQWRLVYADEWNAVYFRENYAPDVLQLASPAVGRDYPELQDAEVGRIMGLGSKQRPAGWVRALQGEAMFPMTAVRRSAFYLLARQPLAARNWALQGIADCEVFFPDAWINLAYALATLGDQTKASHCIEVLRVWAPGLETENLARELDSTRRSRAGGI